MRRLLVQRRRLVMLVGYLIVLTGAGLLLGGYTGAVLVPAATVVFGIRRRGWRHFARPGVLAGLVFTATAVGAAGEHQVLSGDIGSVVSAQVNAIPQVICLIVFAGLAAALVRPTP